MMATTHICAVLWDGESSFATFFGMVSESANVISGNWLSIGLASVGSTDIASIGSVDIKSEGSVSAGVDSVGLDSTGVVSDEFVLVGFVSADSVASVT